MDLTALAAAVTNMTNAVQAAETVLTQLSAKVKAAAAPLANSPDPAAGEALAELTKFTDELNAKASELAAAVVANTPADPSAAPPAAAPAPAQ